MAFLEAPIYDIIMYAHFQYSPGIYNEVMTMAKKIFKRVGIVLIVIAAAFLVILIIGTILEFRPEAVETLEVTPSSGSIRGLSPGDSLSVMSFNIGYAALGKNQDFFMDGGSMVRPAGKEEVKHNLNGIVNILNSNPADVYFIQEADIDSRRSYNINEVAAISTYTGKNSVFAYNYNSFFVPYPLPPLGKVESGLLTLTGLDVQEAMRVSLPVPFKWPVSMFNLKRCLLVERIPVGEKDLVLVNLHLEAYDDGEGKEAQTKELMSILSREYESGNYVIAGGDFNQTFPGANYPVLDPGYWAPGVLEESMLPEGWRFAVDPSTPTCRLLNEPFAGSYEGTQLYVIDGYILSPNVKLGSVETLDLGFEYSDHHPVKLEITLE